MQQRLIEGPVEELLSVEQPERFRATFRFGVLVLDQQHFLKREDPISTGAHKASWLAGEIRRACEPALEPLPLDAELPEPAWTGTGGRRLGRASPVGTVRTSAAPLP